MQFGLKLLTSDQATSLKVTPEKLLTEQCFKWIKGHLWPKLESMHVKIKTKEGIMTHTRLQTHPKLQKMTLGLYILYCK